MLTDRFDDAFHYAHRLHRAQMRKGTPIPYISHLMTVAALVITAAMKIRRLPLFCMTRPRIRAAQKHWMT